MNISDFNEPVEHPYGMCAAYNNAFEKEQFLTFMLQQCIIKNDLYAEIITAYNHDSLVKDGLLEKVRKYRYKLTKRSVGMLYSYYGV